MNTFVFPLATIAQINMTCCGKYDCHVTCANRN